MHLLIGATGTVGQHVAAAYRGRRDVRLLVHTARSAEAARAAGFTDVVAADLADPATLQAPFEGVRRLFLLTPAGPHQHTMELNALAAAERAGVERVVKISLLYVGDPPSIRLKRAHEIVEEHLARSRVSWLAVQPPAFVDNLLWQLESLREGRLVFPAGSGRISHIDARDVAAVAVAAMTDVARTGRLRITGPESLDYEQLARRIGEHLGRPIAYVAPAPADWRAGAIATGMPAEVADTYLEAFAYYGAQPVFVATEAIEQARGAPARPVDEYIRERLVPALAGRGGA